jgi:hypothetical protein
MSGNGTSAHLAGELLNQMAKAGGDDGVALKSVA